MTTNIVTKQRLDPETLVARMIAELQANPEAQRLLLRALLTNEFLGMPARLERVERDVAEMKADVKRVQANMKRVEANVKRVEADVAELKTVTHTLSNDVGELKGHVLELRFHGKMGSLICQALGLRRPQILQGALLTTGAEFGEAIAAAADDGRISDDREERILATDAILRAQRRSDRTPVWVAVEVSHRVDEHDVDRARASADTLATVFGEEAVAVVAGCRIDSTDRSRAAAADVRYVEVPGC